MIRVEGATLGLRAQNKKARAKIIPWLKKYF
jgi:hypothetical protein